MAKKVVICGIDTSSLPKLNYKEQTELLLQIANGDKTAREKFITANYRLVLSVVQRFGRQVDSLDDLFQIGCVGLIKAVDNFNPSLNVRFSTYAVPLIIGEIKRFLRERNSMRVSRGIRNVAYKALQVKSQLEESNASVTVDDIAEKMDVSVSKVNYCLDALSDPVSLFEDVFSSENDSVTLMDQLTDESQCESVWADKVTLYEALVHLDGREKNIIYKRYFQGKTQTEISQEIGLSQAQISRLEKDAVSFLRQTMS